MYATFTCEQCWTEYESEDGFVRCAGDACKEEVCKQCLSKCKDPSCKHQICNSCKDTAGPYCEDHLIMDHEGEMVDYIAEGKTFAVALCDVTTAEEEAEKD